ncbi:dihydrofolate reductase, partial [Stereum hirsutum FP-91666 SS1]|uniref:dihydrofolate reductase n=1 Tax=Stereum hirsutum (strain FP-91666) TaxID=721885 RepID=UPI000440C7C6
ERPYVTLTFAQSLDAKIAGRGGVQLMISGDESMKMTHWMRTMHDGILIGVGTATNDNPQLNVRHLPFPPQNTHLQHYHHPRPIVLDPALRLSKKCKLIANASKGAGVAPWIVAARPSKADGFWASEGDEDSAKEWEARKETLEAAGAKVILIEQPILHPDLPSTSTDLDLSAVLKALRAEDIKSVMVEGGARIIQSFLSSTVESGIIDTLVVTTAPGFIGRDGVGYGEGLSRVPGMRYVATEVMGKDTIVGFKVAS